mmetsp:Transcript_63540/g.207196  ORF Transcript_63540/g.207196 Transcript_63540/m.207196 type:complete len:200 (+) Transcript_63540:315-914(+)
MNVAFLMTLYRRTPEIVPTRTTVSMDRREAHKVVIHQVPSASSPMNAKDVRIAAITVRTQARKVRSFARSVESRENLSNVFAALPMCSVAISMFSKLGTRSRSPLVGDNECDGLPPSSTSSTLSAAAGPAGSGWLRERPTGRRDHEGEEPGVRALADAAWSGDAGDGGPSCAHKCSCSVKPGGRATHRGTTELSPGSVR